MLSQVSVCPQGDGGWLPACITDHMTGEGGLHTGEGSASRGGGGLHPERVRQTPPTGTRKAGGTHPTGMFSCLNMLCLCGSGSKSLFGGILCVRRHSVSGSL